MSEISQRTKALRSDAEMWGMVSHKITNDMLNIKVIQKMFKELGKGFDAATAEAWLKENYKDNPETMTDESVTYKQLEDLVDRFGGGTPGEHDLGNFDDSNIKKVFRTMWAKRDMVHMHIDAIHDQIEDLSVEAETLTGEDATSEGGGMDSEFTA